MEDSEVVITPAARVKKQVSPELLERLAKAREVAAQKRKEAKEAKVVKAANEAKGAGKQEKAKQAPPEPDSESETESESSVSSSDTSDSDVSLPNKRGKKPVAKRINKQEYKEKLDLEIAKAREKYKNRYKSRYEHRAVLHSPSVAEPEPSVANSVTANSVIKRHVKNVAKHDLQQALNKELVKTAMANLFG
jgi:hypothetical protein